MNMAKFERVNFLKASLTPGEVHLHSFKGFLCKWDQGRFSTEEAPILIQDATLLGHVTNSRLIIEPREVNSTRMIPGELSPNFFERIGLEFPGDLFDMEGGGKEAMKYQAEQMGYLSLDFADMDHFGVYEASACWPVMNYYMNGRDPAFLPYNLYSITAYTGAILGPPAPAEFAEVIGDRGVRIVTYTSKVP
jgi:hypothetical protein